MQNWHDFPLDTTEILAYCCRVLKISKLILPNWGNQLSTRNYFHDIWSPSPILTIKRYSGSTARRWTHLFPLCACRPHEVHVGGRRLVARNSSTDGITLASVVAEDAGAEKFAILSQMMHVPKGCEEVAMVADEVAIAAKGGRANGATTLLKGRLIFLIRGNKYSADTWCVLYEPELFASNAPLRRITPLPHQCTFLCFTAATDMSVLDCWSPLQNIWEKHSRVSFVHV